MTVVEKKYDMGLRMVSVVFDEPITRGFADAEVLKFTESQNLSFKSTSNGVILCYINNETLSTLNGEGLRGDIAEFKAEYWFDDEVELDPQANESTIKSKTVIGSLDQISLYAKEFDDKPITEVHSIVFTSSESLFLSNAIDKKG